MFPFKLSDKVYGVIKWTVAIVMPLFGTLVGAVGGEIHWEYTELFLKIWTALTAFLGGVMGISNLNYKKGGD